MTSQGAIFRRISQGGASTAPWQILKKGWGEKWKVIAQMQRRPSNTDLEAAFYHASAEESPITAGIKAVKQLVPNRNK